MWDMVGRERLEVSGVHFVQPGYTLLFYAITDDKMDQTPFRKS